jgi:hypothetical protein
MKKKYRKEFVRQVAELLKASTPDEQRRILAAIRSRALRLAAKKGAGI